MEGRERGYGSRSRALIAAAVGMMLVAVAAPCEAQRWTAGVRAGINAGRMSFEDETAGSLSLATPGAYVGLAAGWRMTALLELRGEVALSEKGFDSNVDEQLKLTYVEIPLLLSLRWPVTLSPRLFFGPVVSLEAKCRSHRVLGLGELACDDALASLRRRRTDLGLALGAGVGFGVGPGEMSIELRATQGIRDISEEDRPTGYVHNQVLGLSAAFTLPIGSSE